MTFQAQVAATQRRLRANATTIQLSLSYLAIIMIFSVGFSVVFYKTSVHELGRQIPPSTMVNPLGGDEFGYGHFFERRISEGSGDLFDKLVLMNFGALLAGSVVSYVLARRTLEPIEHAMEAQSRFASDASHELRTPLAAIQAENEVALRSKNLTLSQAKELLRSNLEEANKLKELSEALLELAQQDQEGAFVGPVSLVDVATEAMNRIIKPAQAKHISLQDEVAKIQVLAEKQHLVQVVAVLLDNAVKYSAEGATVYVTGYAKGRFGYMSIRDEGIGIPADALPYIFDRFYQVESSRTKQSGGGYGLGLSIAYKIMQQVGGEISVESSVGTGSTFTITLPLVPVA